MNTILLLIDMQNDFCSPEGTLFVPGSEQDCKNTASYIERNGKNLSSICVTLDCHSFYHIAHPVFWKNAEGNHPEPFTVIRYQNLIDGDWTPYDNSLSDRVKKYVLELETRGKYELTVWPQHCLQGSWGISIESRILKAVRGWETARGKNACFISKSQNTTTEHYSVIQAEVPDPADETTRANFTLIDRLKAADRIIIAGEALSHCVLNTIQDIMAYVPAQKLTLLTDCTTSIKGYESLSRRLLAEFTAKGMKTTRSDIAE